MRRAIAMPGALLALLLACGCGSGSASSTDTPAASTTPAPATAASTAAGSPQVDKQPVYASPPASAPVHSGLVNVNYHLLTIQPDTLKVRVGSTVRWTNEDPVQHNVTSEGGAQHFASKDFGRGGTFEIKLNRPGVIHYLCTLHPVTMNGTIDVVR